MVLSRGRRRLLARISSAVAGSPAGVCFPLPSLAPPSQERCLNQPEITLSKRLVRCSTAVWALSRASRNNASTRPDICQLPPCPLWPQGGPPLGWASLVAIVITGPTRDVRRRLARTLAAWALRLPGCAHEVGFEARFPFGEGKYMLSPWST